MAARGTFSASTYATLSRTQVEFGGSSTFGLEIALAECPYDPQKAGAKKKGSSFKLGKMVERGCFNYRWPFNEYHLDLFEDQNDPGLTEDDSAVHVGNCQMFSCSMDGIFYQVLRIEEGDQTKTSNPRNKFPSPSQAVLTIGGPVWFHYFDGDLNLTEEQKVGNLFFCTRRLDADDHQSAEDEVQDVSPPDAMGTTIRFWDKKRCIGLEVQVYQVSTDNNGQYDYKKLKMEVSDSAWDSGTAETQGDFKVKTVKAYNATVPLPDNTTSATFLAAIRFIPDLVDSKPWPHPPTSKKMYEYIGVSPSSPDATGAMWQTVFTERRTESPFVLSLAEFNLVGRALEKILQVDIIPAMFSDPPGAAMTDANKDNHASSQESALVSNIFLHSNVDLLSLL
jgi:hypothetical protein